MCGSWDVTGGIVITYLTETREHSLELSTCGVVCLGGLCSPDDRSTKKTFESLESEVFVRNMSGIWRIINVLLILEEWLRNVIANCGKQWFTFVKRDSLWRSRGKSWSLWSQAKGSKKRSLWDVGKLWEKRSLAITSTWVLILNVCLKCYADIIAGRKIIQTKHNYLRISWLVLEILHLKATFFENVSSEKEVKKELSCLKTSVHPKRTLSRSSGQLFLLSPLMPLKGKLLARETERERQRERERKRERKRVLWEVQSNVWKEIKCVRRKLVRRRTWRMRKSMWWTALRVLESPDTSLKGSLCQRPFVQIDCRKEVCPRVSLTPLNFYNVSYQNLNI